MSSVAGYIVWIRGTRGPELQKWREPPPDLSGYWAKRVIGHTTSSPAMQNSACSGCAVDV